MEKKEAKVIAEKLRTPLDARGDAAMAARFLKGGYGQDGYGVPEGAAVDGSHAFAGSQGYYAKGANGEETGKQVFLGTVAAMKAFFQRREKKLGKSIRYVIKPGIGGQHTPFQGIADVFQATDTDAGRIAGEYELGKDFEQSISRVLQDLGADWSQVAVIPSSKSGSTDETMMIFTDIFYTLLKHIAAKQGIDGTKFADRVLEVLHDVNFTDGKERPGKDLFKVDAGRFKTDSLITLVFERTQDLEATREQVLKIFGMVLGNMFFETTDRPDQSRLSAFIRNSGLDKELGEDAPGFGAMFDNVGGRWTGDLHMMTFLAFHDLDAEKYWEKREKGIRAVQAGTHRGNQIAHRILDKAITDIALVVPDEFFWFGKSIEQNFNESIWQKGFVNLVAIRESEWALQQRHYAGAKDRLVIDLPDMGLTEDIYQVQVLPVDTKRVNKEAAAAVFAELLTTFYGMTNTAGTRLIARALQEAGFSAADVDLNNLDHPATRIVQQNLFLLQPYVELGKGLLEKRLKAIQEEEAKRHGAIQAEYEAVRHAAHQKELKSNLENGFQAPAIQGVLQLDAVIHRVMAYAQAHHRKLVPFIYLEGRGFHALRDHLIELGIEWVMQGTGDQHISYQQVLAQPQKYLAFIISFVPDQPKPAHPAIGFAKGYLDRVTSPMVRDLFAEASYNALTDLRKEQGGQGLFLRLPA